MTHQAGRRFGKTAVDVFVCRENAKRFIEEVRGDDPDLASYLRIEEREVGELH